MPEVTSWFSNLGHGNPQIYYNHIQRNDAANYAEVFVQLHEYDTRRDAASSCEALRERLDALSRRAHLREGIRERPADLGADLGARDRAAISTSSSS